MAGTVGEAADVRAKIGTGTANPRIGNLRTDRVIGAWQCEKTRTARKAMARTAAGGRSQKDHSIARGHK